jgi:hypothetical protein
MYKVNYMNVLLCHSLEESDYSHEMRDSHSSVAEDSSVPGWEGVLLGTVIV